MTSGQRTFAVSLLHKLNIAPNPQNVRALVGWEKAEGGHWHNTAKFNPLNTTQPMPGAGSTGAQGNIKVYRSWQQGLDATARTLRNGRYENIIQALRAGSPGDVANAIGQSPWGTNGSLVRQVIGGVPAQPTGTPTPKPPKIGKPAPSNANADRFAAYAAYAQNPHTPGASTDLALSLLQSQRQAAAPASSPAPAAPRVTGRGGAAAVAWAKSRLGTSETTGPNRGPRVDQWEARFGLSGQPWCAIFTSLAVTKGGAPASARTPSVAVVRQQAQTGRGGYQHGFVNPRQARKGDLILFGNEHIGMVESVGRNGITMIAGNDANRVEQRTVPLGSGDIVRPKYGAR